MLPYTQNTLLLKPEWLINTNETLPKCHSHTVGDDICGKFSRKKKKVSILRTTLEDSFEFLKIFQGVDLNILLCPCRVCLLHASIILKLRIKRSILFTVIFN